MAWQTERSRWPNEIDTLETMGRDNLDGMQDDIEQLRLDVDWERTGMLSVATEPHQVAWLRGGRTTTARVSSLVSAKSVTEVASPTYLAGLFSPDTLAIVHPAKLALELARACRHAGVRIFERTKVTSIDASGPTLRFGAGPATISADRAVLATNVFPSLIGATGCRPCRCTTTCWQPNRSPTAQLDRIGWANRQGIGDCANQFHYYRLTTDNRIVWGGYDAVYYFGRKVKPGYEDRPATYRRLAQHFFITFPQLDDVRFSHRWAGAIDTSTRFCAHWGLARGGRVAYVNGFTGLGVGAARFAADVCLDLLDGRPTERTELEMVRKRPLPFPPEPLASIGIQATRWSLDRADHSAGRRNLLLRTLDALGLGFDS